jgi:ornithine cyclodeaminase/alanine dehydrogenase-like protein (mu-crystallin family)
MYFTLIKFYNHLPVNHTTTTMESNQPTTQEAANQVYNYAANLMVNQKKETYEVRDLLIAKGLDEKTATTIVDNLEQQISDAKKSRAKKDMLYGALWCVGGTVLTVAHIGFIFWGAIIFGAIQFFRGVANMS